jgi:hypothetical protein
MIDSSFFTWIDEQYAEEELTLDELDALLHDDKKAARFFDDFMDSNKEAISEWVRWQIKDFLYEVEKYRDE